MMPRIMEDDTETQDLSSDSDHLKEDLTKMPPPEDIETGHATAGNNANANKPKSAKKVKKVDMFLKKDNTDSTAYLHVLKETLEGAGRWAFGIAAIEIWKLNPSKGYLERCKGGWWRDRVFEDTVGLNRLEDSTRDDYLSPEPLVPGVGVAGALWIEVKSSNGLAAKWRDLQQMSEDPDQPPDERLKVLAETFGLATAISFIGRGTNADNTTKGVVIYYARRSVDLSKIYNKANSAYLKSSADLLGAVAAWEQPRSVAVIERKADLSKALLHAKEALLKAFRAGTLEEDIYSAPQDKSAGNFSSSTLKRFEGKSIRDAIKNSARMAGQKSVKAVSKMKGGGQSPPPAFSREQCVFAFFGCFLSLLSVSGINEAITDASGGNVYIILGPLGALVTCHYGLTGAPASQPRNSILGILIAASIAYMSTYIPTSVLPVWVRVALIPSIAIVVLLALGLPHPPAGGLAVSFASLPSPNWSLLGLLIFGYFTAIMFATIFINFHEGKNFPMYWGFPRLAPIGMCLVSLCGPLDPDPRESIMETKKLDDDCKSLSD